MYSHFTWQYLTVLGATQFISGLCQLSRVTTSSTVPNSPPSLDITPGQTVRRMGGWEAEKLLHFPDTELQSIKQEVGLGVHLLDWSGPIRLW